MFDTTNAKGFAEVLEVLSTFAKRHLYGEFIDIYDLEEAIDELSIENAIFNYNSGASRLGIWEDSWDFVLKIDTHEYEEDSACEREIYNHQKAKEYGIADLFLPIEEFADLGSFKVYIQPRMIDIFSHMNYAKMSNHYPKYEDNRDDKISWICEELPRLPTIFARALLNHYGEQLLNNLVCWVLDTKANDFHGSNVGFYNEKPVFFDYAGFYEN